MKVLLLEKEKLSHIIAVVLLLAAVQIIAFAEYFGIPQKGQFTDIQVFCTQEAKLCPDGSAVGHTGPNCEFAECAKPSIAQIDLREPYHEADTSILETNIIFGREAEDACGPQPPASCATGLQLGCDRKTRKWGCYPKVSGMEEIDTSIWQTYRNEEYGFEVRYPSNWELSESELRDVVNIGNPLHGNRWYAIDIFILPNPENLSADRYAKKITGESHDAVVKNGIGVDLSLIKDYPISIGQVSGYELYNVFQYDQRSEFIYITNKNYAYQIAFPIAQENPNLSNPVENNLISHQILSTFKFIE